MALTEAVTGCGPDVPGCMGLLAFRGGISGLIATVITVFTVLAGAFIVFRYVIRKPARRQGTGGYAPPPDFREVLSKRIRFYSQLDAAKKAEFEDRIIRFLSEKKITGIDTAVTDDDLLLVASSAVIPMFAFPYYNYPGVYEILLYPGSFDREFHTDAEAAGKDILGMVGDGFLKGHVLLSKPDLEAAFDGTRHKNNVGIHEFIHLIDKADGAVDGIPEILFDHSFAFSWLREIKREITKIKEGHSDISPYALKNNAEFLAVVGEYFFDNPDKMKSRHPDLYEYLVKIFRQSPANKLHEFH